MEGEAALLEAALTMNVERFRRRVKAWAITFTLVAQEREAVKEARKQVLNLFEKDEGWMLNGFLTDKNGEMVNKMLNAAMGRKALGATGEYNERRAGAFINIFTKVTQYADTQPSARMVPHVSVLTDLSMLAVAGLRAREAGDAATVGADAAVDATGGEYSAGAGSMAGSEDAQLGKLKAVIPAGIASSHFEGLEPAALENGRPLTPSQLQTILCDSEIARIVLGPKSAELDVGRSSRTCTPKQARAVIARDRTCRYPGCDQLYQSSHIHHVQHWRDGGRTDIDNLIMLCWYHHEKVHAENITIKHYEGGWVFIDKNGICIRDPLDRRPPPDGRELSGRRKLPDRREESGYQELSDQGILLDPEKIHRERAG
ncbi:hypothetical protein J2S70_000659 [Trueperella bonasi]|uniref:HNH nuclease domain-containing protein n=1 Tax=Trueperella bonasi TaxID=312286 RepID=A0ABT9NFC7_9ACTO|nr:HNH endonuclease signature motif containing protein [Trueperella bonasi]MDP9806077.1 hypothetical protein [Trueperella bonasi]